MNGGRGGGRRGRACALRAPRLAVAAAVDGKRWRGRARRWVRRRARNGWSGECSSLGTDDGGRGEVRLKGSRWRSGTSTRPTEQQQWSRGNGHKRQPVSGILALARASSRFSNNVIIHPPTCHPQGLVCHTAHACHPQALRAPSSSHTSGRQCSMAFVARRRGGLSPRRGRACRSSSPHRRLK